MCMIMQRYIMCMIMQRYINTPPPRLPWSHFRTAQGQRDRARWLSPPPPTRLPPHPTAANRVCNHRQQVCCVPCACAPNTQASPSSYLHPLKQCHSVPCSFPPQSSTIAISHHDCRLHIPPPRALQGRIAGAAPHPGGRAERRRRDGNHAIAPRDVNKDSTFR